VLAKCKQIVAAVNKWYHKWMHKCWIEIPKNNDDCMQIDHENSNNFWQDAICLEMAKVPMAFQILNDNESIKYTNRYIVIWSLVRRWKISAARHDL
jgi:hypothetical protein